MDELASKKIRAAVEDDKAFRLLYDYYSPFVWRVIYRMVHGDSQLAEQILQSVFITVHKSLKKFKFKSAFSTWVYQITWREALHQLKKKKREREQIVPFVEDFMGTEDKTVASELNDLLTKLSETERFLLVSRELDGFSFEELAKITGKQSGSLRTAVSRIKEKLREVYRGEE
jgi:RNA polymerase sigma-70 factor, ECF subfamily